ncbi:MAG: hypothetical protein LBS09_09475 [Bacteroidales bacterium]|jgi:hypothetical protein|nr:hypothetical protein [Bacteroidales bacterium]
MKKINVFLAFCTVMALSACKGPTGPQGPAGRDGIPAGWHNIVLTIDNADWELAGGGSNEIGSYFRYVFDVPELTADVYDEGIIVCYYELADDQGVVVSTPLPFTIYDIVTDDQKNEYPYSIHYSYDVTPGVGKNPGTIAFKLTFSDFFTGDFGPPAICKFRLALVY